MNQSTALKLITNELSRATKSHGSFASAHEGFAVLQEEVDELWTEVKANNSATHRGASEAVQVATMAIRFLMDVCPEETAVKHEAKVLYYGSGSYSG